MQALDDNRAEESLWYVSDIPDPSGNPALKIWKEKHSGEYRVRYSHGLTFYLNAAVTDIRVRCDQPIPLDDIATFLLGPVFGIVLRLRGITCLHASAVALEDKAIAFMGVPAAGKSTTAALFAQKGHLVLTDDIAALVERDRSFCVLPAYPYVNLWPETLEMLAYSESSSSSASTAVDKVRVPLDGKDSKFQREALPLAAIYVLAERSADSRAPFIEVLPPQAALMNLVANTYGNTILDSTMRAHEFRVLGQIAESLPIRSLVAREGAAQLARLYDLVCEDLARSFR
ncbi:MAG: hypothetical protein ACYC93_08050 [Candidatus Acidiferrales bacterium]